MELWKPSRRTILRVGGLIAAPAIIGRAMAQVPLTGAGLGAPGGPPPSTTTWNPSDKDANLGLSGGNLTVTQNINGIYEGVRSIASHSTGKYYWEDTLNLGANGVNGFANAAAVITGNFIGQGAGGVGYFPAGTIFMNGSGPTVQTAVSGDVIGYALDMGNLKFWVRTIHSGVPGNWNNSGTDNPATNTGGFDYTGLAAGPYFAAASLNGIGNNITTNFGASAFAASAPAGFGNW